MNIKSALKLGSVVLLLSSTVQAGLIVRSIDLAIVETTFNSRSLPDSMTDAEAFDVAMDEGFLPAYNDAGAQVCEESFEALEGLSSRRSCGGPRRNTGSLYTVRGHASGPAQLQFGMDWGRGGFTFLSLDGADPLIDRFDSDIWWRRNWNNRDVLDLTISQPGHFLIMALGFENCCDGINSARWRPLDSVLPEQSDPVQWQALSVNVPEPGALSLSCLGLVAIGAVRRRRLRRG